MRTRSKDIFSGLGAALWKRKNHSPSFQQINKKNLGWHTLIVLIKTWAPRCLVCVCFLWEPGSCPTTERVLSHDSDSESSADVMAYIVLKKCLPCRKWNKVLGLSRNGVRIKRLLWICGFSQAALEMSHANPNSIWVTDSLQPAFLNRLLVL